MNKDGRERAIVRAYGPDDEAVRLAVHWAVGRARESSNLRVAVLVHGLSQIRTAAQTLGAANAERVTREKTMRAAGLDLGFHNSRAWSQVQGVPQVCLWLTDDDMAKVERTVAPATVLVTWTREEGRAWAAGHGAVDLRGSDPADDLPTLDPVVQAALETIEGVNPSGNLSHPSDKGRVVQAFEMLNQAGYALDPEAIRAALTGGRLTDDTAAAVAKIAAMIIAGHRFRVHRPLREDILDLWREQAASPWG